MEIKQIESVYWVHKLGSFSAAAQYLHTTQPNISGRIQALERELGVAVFDRSNRQAKLTGRGHAILREAERIIDAMRELRRQAVGGIGLSGTVRLGTTNTVAQTWLPQLIRRLGDTHKNVDIDFHVDTYALLKHQFRDHEIDLLICTEHLSDPGTVSQFLYRTSFDCVASKQMWFGSDPVSVQELLQHRLITYPRGTRLHDSVMDYFKRTGTMPAHISRSNSLAAMMKLVSSGVGVCTMPGVALDARYADTLRILPMRTPLPPIDFYASYKLDPLNQLVPLIADTAREICLEFDSPAAVAAARTAG